MPVVIYFLFSLLSITFGEAALCTGSDYVEGQWFYNSHPDFKKSFICCAHEPGVVLYNETLCGPPNPLWTTLKTHTEASFTGSNQFFPFPAHHSCTCDATEGTWLTPSRRERYYWQPTRCSLPVWDAKDFCRLLNNRNILFVGDSTLHQSGTTLTAMIKAGDGGCADRIFNVVSENLVTGKQGWDSPSLLTAISLTRHPFVPDFAVIGSGAHVHSIEEYETNWKSIQIQLHVLHQQYKKLKFIWKNQNPGHLKCSDFSEPVKTAAKMEEDPEHPQYRWNLHDDYDRISAEHIKDIISFYREHKGYRHRHDSGKIPFIQVMDMSPLKYRPDSHPRGLKDCLHYCAPGALDIFSTLMYNLFLTGQL
jgi:hypothetical protein